VSPDDYDLLHLDTLAVRAASERSQYGEHAEALFLTSSYVFDSAEQAAARFGNQEQGMVYSRFSNPTVDTFTLRLALMEGAEAGIATASGMAAITLLALSVLKAGDHVLCARSLFGATVQWFGTLLPRFGVQADFVDGTDLAAWRAGFRPNTRLVFVESPSNPLCEVVDIAAVAALCKDAGALLAVDNCFCTPALQKPLELGADVVMHSATKFIDGQGRVLGGALLGSRAFVDEQALPVLRTMGMSMSPFNAWVLAKGLETLSLRMQRHCDNAEHIAQHLLAHPKVRRVHFAGLPEHPGHALAARQQRRFGSMLSFDVGDRAAAFRLINACRIASITGNLGDAKTTITHPASTTHARLTPEARAAAGIGEGLIRLSVGLEDVRDLVADLERALAAV
jgi:O-succinylhomoserine sulfhydrylase